MIKIKTTLLLVIISMNGLLAQKSFNFAKSNNYFTFEAYRNIAKNYKNSNVCFSPLSIYEAMAIVYNGAKDQTKKEFQQSMKFPYETKELNESYITFNKKLTNNIKDVELQKVNALWMQKDFCFLSEYKKQAQENYNAKLEFVDFKKKRKRKKAVLKINQWANKNTNGKINNLLNPDLIKESTRLIITNAIYFNGMWQTQFTPSKNSQDVFYGSKGKTETTFMNTQHSFNYYSDRTMQVLELPYKNEKQSMFIILPQGKNDLLSVEKALNNDYLQKITSKAHKKSVNVSIPKFKSSSDYELSKIFENMGMKSAFNSNANFSDITGRDDLFIDNIFHKTTVELSEKGTEAAAATAVVMSRKSISISEKFIANRPFIYFICDNSTQAVLFMGRINDIK